jgi:hypothetical protein
MPIVDRKPWLRFWTMAAGRERVTCRICVMANSALLARLEIKPLISTYRVRFRVRIHAGATRLTVSVPR